MLNFYKKQMRFCDDFMLNLLAIFKIWYNKIKNPVLRLQQGILKKFWGT